MIRGDRLRDLRRAKELSADEASAQMGMSRAQLVNYETGKTDPTTQVLARLMTFYEVSGDYLLGITDDPKTRRLSTEELTLISLIRARKYALAQAVLTAIIFEGARGNHPQVPEEDRNSLSDLVKQVIEDLENKESTLRLDLHSDQE